MKETSRTPNAGKLAGLLGIARRAGRLTTGFDAVAGLIGEGKAALVMLASDLSEKTQKEVRYAAQGKPVPVRRMPLTKEEAGTACGLKKPVGVLATDDNGFAKAMETGCLPDLEEDSAI